MSTNLTSVKYGYVHLPIEVGSPDWFAWLERTDAFSVEEDGISFIAHRVHRGEAALWLAFCAIDHEVRWTVLGATPELTRERLQAAAHQMVSSAGAIPEYIVGAEGLAGGWEGSLRRLPVTSPDLLVTKLEAPTIATEKLVRTHALDRMAHVLDYPLSVVNAPSGYGKTTLLAEWAGETHARVAWLVLDANDNDPTRFCTHVLAALDRVAPGALAAGLPYEQNAPAQLSDVGLLTRLINVLATAESEIALVIDDYHALSPDSVAIHDAMLYLVEHLPARVHIILLTRTRLPLRTSKLRVQQKLLELRIGDLRFTEDEAHRFLEQSTGKEVPPEASARIHARTEGWVAGLQLAALALGEEVEPADRLADHMSEHRYVVDFLADEVLRRLPREVGENVLRIAALDRFNVALCDALPGVVDCQTTLEILERENAFLVPMDDSHGWYRFHGLFADVLRKRLRQLHPEQPAELYRRAGSWYEMNGIADEAVHYALLADDEDTTVRIVRGLDKRLLDGGDAVASLSAVLERSLDALPEAIIRRHPQLCLAQAHFLLRAEHPTESEQWLENAAALMARGTPVGRKAAARDEFAQMKDEVAQLHHDIDRIRQNALTSRQEPIALPARQLPDAQTLWSAEEGHAHTAAGPALFEAVSARESEVLQLLAVGATNQDIARELVIAVATVKRHVGNIFRKLAAQNRTQAVARARAYHLLADDAVERDVGAVTPHSVVRYRAIPHAALQ